ncbi:MAG: sugar 3,4-ketoisomerase [Desulfovibrionaceae bacterium]
MCTSGLPLSKEEKRSSLPVTEIHKNYKILTFEVFGDSTGSLISLESYKNIPFEIKRVYYIYNTDILARRGKHAHTILQQCIVCMKGSCDFLLDTGKEQEIIHLNTPEQGLYIGNGLWREMYNFSNDCILMVLASNYYDENEYIRDYALFIKTYHNEKNQ